MYVQVCVCYACIHVRMCVGGDVIMFGCTETLRNVHKLKGSDIFINANFSKQTTDLRKEPWREVKQLRSEGKIANLNYRTVVTKRRDNEG